MTHEELSMNCAAATKADEAREETVKAAGLMIRAGWGGVWRGDESRRGFYRELNGEDKVEIVGSKVKLRRCLTRRS